MRDGNHIAAADWSAVAGHYMHGSATFTFDRPFLSGHSTSDDMNRFDRLFGLKGEARVKYMPGEYQVLSPGEFVLCAVTGAAIPLTDLRYWNVELQEAYASAEISLQRYLELRRAR
jgi:hypothetical protein